MLQDREKAIKLYVRAADLGCSQAHFKLGDIYHEGGDMKKATARCNLGGLEAESGNMERAHKHWTIAASAGHYIAMIELRLSFEQGLVSRESSDSTLR